MSKLTLAGLRKLRAGLQHGMARRGADNRDIQVIVGMGTCGIAAGARETCDAVVEAVAAQGLANVLVRQTGCMGLCHSEPTVEVRVPGMPTVIYGNVNAQVGREIVARHVVARQLLDHHICDKPAIDIVG